jgi:hypothetical protein
MADSGFARNFFLYMVFPSTDRLAPFAGAIGGF